MPTLLMMSPFLAIMSAPIRMRLVVGRRMRPTMSVTRVVGILSLRRAFAVMRPVKFGRVSMTMTVKFLP